MLWTIILKFLPVLSSYSPLLGMLGASSWVSSRNAWAQGSLLPDLPCLGFRGNDEVFLSDNGVTGVRNTDVHEVATGLMGVVRCPLGCDGARSRELPAEGLRYHPSWFECFPVALT